MFPKNLFLGMFKNKNFNHPISTTRDLCDLRGTQTRARHGRPEGETDQDQDRVWPRIADLSQSIVLPFVIHASEIVTPVGSQLWSVIGCSCIICHWLQLQLQGPGTTVSSLDKAKLIICPWDLPGFLIGSKYALRELLRV